MNISARRSIAGFFWTLRKFERNTATASPSTASPLTALNASQSFLEKDDDEFDVRNINGVDYYILSNVDNRKVTWTVDNLQVIISGSLSDDEINSMIDSINEG